MQICVSQNGLNVFKIMPIKNLWLKMFDFVDIFMAYNYKLLNKCICEKKQFVTYILYYIFKYILKINNVYVSISDVIYFVNLNFIGVKQKCVCMCIAVH